MIGDKFIYHSTYNEITRFVISELRDRLHPKNRLCISVGGESGCGKTSLAYALKKDIEDSLGLKGFFFHQDDYFKLPPKDNHNARISNIGQTGTDEVYLDLLNTHLLEFKDNKGLLSKPLINYHENCILNETVISSDFDFCIVEGTYVSILSAPDYKLFLESTYLDTRKFRIERARDIIDDFNEEILEIEHQIIKPHYKLADIVIDKSLNILTK